MTEDTFHRFPIIRLLEKWVLWHCYLEDSSSRFWSVIDFQGELVRVIYRLDACCKMRMIFTSLGLQGTTKYTTKPQLPLQCRLYTYLRRKRASYLNLINIQPTIIRETPSNTLISLESHMCHVGWKRCLCTCVNKVESYEQCKVYRGWTIFQFSIVWKYFWSCWCSHKNDLG